MMATPTSMGQVELICGSMFSGKSEELIRRLRRARIAHQRMQVFKPELDTRSGDDSIASHSAMRIEADVATSAQAIHRAVAPETEVIGIDEVQFFDRGIVEVADRLADAGKRIVIAGLDQDFLGRPFEPVPALFAVAEYVTKTLAVCARCGGPANRSQRLVPDDERVLVGANDAYEARCRRCFEPDRSRQLGMDLGEPST